MRCENEVKEYVVTPYSTTVQQTINYIFTHLTEPIYITRIAEEVYMNPSALSRKFRHETGITITKFINQHRIELARDYLSHSDYNITRTALLCGYSDCCYFSRIFKSQTGYTPSVYKKKNTSCAYDIH